MGYAISNLFAPAQALVISVIMAVAWAVTSGLSPTLKQVRDYPPLEIIWGLSYPRWASESIYLNSVQDFYDQDRVEVVLKELGFEKDNYGLDLGMLVVLGIAWRILAFLALYFKNRRLQ